MMAGDAMRGAVAPLRGPARLPELPPRRGIPPRAGQARVEFTAARPDSQPETRTHQRLAAGPAGRGYCPQARITGAPPPPGGREAGPTGPAKPGNPESSQLRFRIPRPSPRRGPTHRGPGPVTGRRGRWHFASRTERLISTPGSGGLDIALCARSCVLAWSRGDADVRRGAPAYGGTPGSGKIVEDLASAEDPVPDS